jgi:hypothetical protein
MKSRKTSALMTIYKRVDAIAIATPVYLNYLSPWLSAAHPSSKTLSGGSIVCGHLKWLRCEGTLLPCPVYRSHLPAAIRNRAPRSRV